jgi:hypothetical protein
VSPKHEPLARLSGEQTWRIIYRVDADAVVIAEVFAKTTQATPAGDQEQPATTEDVRRRGERTMAMEKNKRKRLEKTGWRVGTAGELLGLTKAEEALVDMKMVLGTRHWG